MALRISADDSNANTYMPPQPPTAAASNKRRFTFCYGDILASRYSEGGQENGKRPIRVSGITLKIALVGPQRAGKTHIANQLRGLPAFDTYQPTAGVRILEFDVDIQDRDEDVMIKIELWDCSGDSKHADMCFPAVLDGLHGLAVVYNPENAVHQDDAKFWMSYFSEHGQLAPGQIVLMSHSDGQVRKGAFNVRVKGKNVKVPIVHCKYTILSEEDDPEQNPDWCLNRFRSFVSSVYRHTHGNE